MVFGNKRKTKITEKSRIKSSKKDTTGITVMIIPNSSNNTKTIEFSFDKIMRIVTALVAILIIVIGLIISLAINNYTLKYGDSNTKKTILNLQDENARLTEQVNSLTMSLESSEKALSQIESQLSKSAQNAAEQAEVESIPTEVPVKGGNAIVVQDPTIDSENGEKQDGVVFTALEGSAIVATASGSVISVESDPNYANKVVIDHGNGYITTYRTDALIKVAFGDTVRKNDMIAIITEQEGSVAYEITYNGLLVNPYDMMVN